MILIADVFPELPTAKYVVRYLSQNPQFRTLFNSQHGKRSQILLKSEQRHFYQLFHHSGGSCVGKYRSY